MSSGLPSQSRPPHRPHPKDLRPGEPRNGDPRAGGASAPGASGALPGMSRAEKFEDEKRRIIRSCFSKTDDDGSGMSRSIDLGLSFVSLWSRDKALWIQDS